MIGDLESLFRGECVAGQCRARKRDFVYWVGWGPGMKVEMERAGRKYEKRERERD